MATIKYTKYTFHRPPLIDEERYDTIKKGFNSSPQYAPFTIENFYEKYKTLILIYVIGVPISIVFVNSELELLEIIGGFFLFFCVFGSFSLIPEWFSYATYLWNRNKYYNNYKRHIAYLAYLLTPVDILIVSLHPGCSANLGCSANFDKSTRHRKLGIAKFGKNKKF